MFNLRTYIKQGFLKAVGKMADYQIILNSTGYYEKGVLTEADLAEISEAIEIQYVVSEENAKNSVEIAENIVEDNEVIENVEN